MKRVIWIAQLRRKREPVLQGYRLADVLGGLLCRRDWVRRGFSIAVAGCGPDGAMLRWDVNMTDWSLVPFGHDVAAAAYLERELEIASAEFLRKAREDGATVRAEQEVN